MYMSLYDAATNDKVGVDLVFNIGDKNSGHIICGSNEVTSNAYILIDYGTQCRAEANSGFQISSWVESHGYNSTKTIQTSKSSLSIW